MTSLEHAFMLERSMHLNFQTMLAIYKSGASKQLLQSCVFPAPAAVPAQHAGHLHLVHALQYYASAPAQSCRVACSPHVQPVA